PASCSFNTAIICSSVNRCFFMRPSFNGPDSNPFWRKFAVAGQKISGGFQDPRAACIFQFFACRPCFSDLPDRKADARSK
ncbi:hypothetical protein, partial [Agrobacterium tumefaciens]|uniref:hypothetical protein n=1 Tax=Agrobacterium tumefaciens TaxID=358 RepID=UPI001CC1B38E